MDTNKAKNAKSAIQLVGSDVLTPESFPNALSRSFDERWKRTFAMPIEGEQFFKFTNQKVLTKTYQTWEVPNTVVPQNRDTDEMEHVGKGDGFSYEIPTYVFRQQANIEKTLEEVDDVGVAKGQQKQLVDNSKLTFQVAWADVFNRGIYIDSNSRTSVLADDGGFLVDTDRNNPIAGAGTWSNREAAAVLSETSLFTASLAARLMTGPDGNLFITEIKKMVIPAAKEREMWVLLSSAGKLSSANNDRNWAASTFKMDDVIVYNRMTSSYIYYLLADPKSEDNELIHAWRVKPNVVTWKGDNPDVVKQRIRFAFGIGAGSMRKFLRGGVLS